MAGVVALVIIGAFWIVVLVPPIVRARAEHVSRDSIRDFSFKIRALGGANAPYRPAALRSGRPPMGATGQLVRPAGRPVPGAPAAYSSAASERSAIRRRQVFSMLGLFALVAFMLAISGMSQGWIVFGFAIVMLAGYSALVAIYRPAARARIPLERLAPVRYLPPTQRPTVAPEYVYRRSS